MERSEEDGETNLLMFNMLPAISSKSLGIASSGACNTTMVDPNKDRTHPNLPCKFRFSFSKYDDNTALKMKQYTEIY
jgi:hypothetical protein